MICPRWQGFLIKENDNLTKEAWWNGAKYEIFTRGPYVRCVNCGYQSDPLMGVNRAYKAG